MIDSDDTNATGEISKSQRKRDLLALRKLGEELVALPPAQLRQLTLPAPLVDAIAEARSISAHGARKRQLQFIGKLMRDVDGEAIRAALDRMRQPDRAATQAMHELEALRERLLDEGDSAVEDVINRFPLTDRQHLRSLVRQAHSERKQQGTPKAYRALFRYLRELMEKSGSENNFL